MREWEEHMHDFEPSDLLTITVPSRTEEVFYEQVEEVPSKIRGAFYIGSGEKKKMDFWIVKPSEEAIFVRQDKNEGIFYFLAEERGLYSFVFSNKRYWETKDVTFAIHFGNHSESHIEAEHLDPISESLHLAESSLKDLDTELKFSAGRQEAHNRSVRDSLQTNYWIAAVECLCIVSLSFAQIYFIKKILDNKRII